MSDADQVIDSTDRNVLAKGLPSNLPDCHQHHGAFLVVRFPPERSS